MPAEWARHEATWLSWPHNVGTWPGVLSAAEAAMVQVVAALAPHERVRINVLDADHRRHVRALLDPHVPAERVTFHEIPTNDAWIRDHGAIFVFADSGDRIALDFDYNAWGGKYPPWDRDQAVAGQMAQALGVSALRPEMVLEGGSVDVNGTGCLLTTEQCLLNANRNPSLSREQIEDRLAECLGATQIVWLGQGIDGDDTDGHIDDITRFVSETTVVTVVERNAADVNYAALEENRSRLQSVEIAGRPIELVDLPMPAPVLANGQRLPASYANFYIANEVVLVPVFSDPADETALGALRTCFRSRRVVPIEARALVHGLGGIHCLTQQVPAIGEPTAGR
jgi:agmatine deiminase